MRGGRDDGGPPPLGPAAVPLGDSDSRQLGPYRLLGLLGRGRNGPVYLGRGAPRRGARKQLAAVRALRPELLRDRQTRARLRQDQLAVAARVREERVAGALGCELDSERPWLAAEFVPGPALGPLVARHGPLPESGVRALGGALAHALSALHSAGAAHGDLRPENVLLDSGAPRVVDYALGPGAAARGADADGAGGGPGEQAAARAADVFALGAVLVFAATAQLPSPAARLAAAPGPPEPSGVPEALRPVLLGCLHPVPDSRPSPEAVARALDPAGWAQRPATDWLPEVYALEIAAVAREARALSGRRLFGR